MEPILAAHEAHVKFMKSLYGGKSDCCSAPLLRVGDELLGCTCCGHLCTDQELFDDSPSVP